MYGNYWPDSAFSCSDGNRFPVAGEPFIYPIMPDADIRHEGFAAFPGASPQFRPCHGYKRNYGHGKEENNGLMENKMVLKRW